MSEHHITPLRTYLIIAATLLFLSGVTVWVSYVDLGALNIVVAMLVGGTHLPKHFGQSGHPNPEPETRTNPPTKINR